MTERTKSIDELPCLVCGTAVKRDAQFSGDWRSIPASNWGAAGTVEISCGFGSRFDMGVYHAVICDQCIADRAERIRQVENTYRPPARVIYTTDLQPEFFNALAIPTADAKFTAAGRAEQMERARREFTESLREAKQ